MIKLGVNIDHVATVRQARRESFPDPVRAALEAVAGGATGITAHLREDRRHIQDRDIFGLKKNLPVPLNMEMAISPEIVKVALKVKPEWTCLVPEKRQELTTEGGLDVKKNFSKLKTIIPRLKSAGISVSLFVDPTIKNAELAKTLGADAIEIHTGTFSKKWGTPSVQSELSKIKSAADRARSLGLIVNAGHGIDYENVKDLTPIFPFHEFNIGFAIVARAISVGLKTAVAEMNRRMNS